MCAKAVVRNSLYVVKGKGVQRKESLLALRTELAGLQQ